MMKLEPTSKFLQNIIQTFFILIEINSSHSEKWKVENSIFFSLLDREKWVKVSKDFFLSLQLLEMKSAFHYKGITGN